MKKLAVLVSLGVFLAVSCEKREQGIQVNFTPCQQTKAAHQEELSDRVEVEFTSAGIKITYYNFEVTCDFATVNVTYAFVNGFLNIAQQGSPNQANCRCYTDVSYTISGISQSEVNLIFINGVQVYCYNNSENVPNNQSNCDKDVIISAYEFENAPDGFVSIIDMKIEDNCLNVKFGASGCSGSSWIAELIDSGSVYYSIAAQFPAIPAQRTLRLSLDNNEDCTAVFTKEVSFNIEDLQVTGINKVLLNISGKMIIYEY